MLPNNRVPTHPGEILFEEFLKPAGISQVAFANHIGISGQHINNIVSGKQSITPKLAWLFSQAFGTTPDFWMSLQSAHDLELYRPATPVVRLPQFAD